MANNNALNNLQRELLFNLRDKLEAGAHGEKGAIKREYAEMLNCSLATLHRWLKKYADYETKRRPRSDRGKSQLSGDALEFMGALIGEAVRANNKSILPTSVAMNVAAQNGFDINVSPSRVNALLREKRIDVKTQAARRNHIRMRSLHPNHVHQIDPSLCVLYYMGGRQHVMDAAEFYKNKPDAINRVVLKVWRYVRYDHASGCIDVRYYESAGENQRTLFDFLMWTWGKQDGRMTHGVPQILLWDKGSANTSGGIQRLLDALGVRHETHATHHAWAKGGVEKANDIVERQFESRLRAEPVETCEQLNAAVLPWVRDYNANAIEHVDSRVRRDGGAYVRSDLWSRILQTPEALVALPEERVCAWFMTGAERTRKVRDMCITMVHPQSGKSELYDLNAYAEHFHNGERVRVEPMLMGDCALRVMLSTTDGQERYVEVTPVREFDDFGRPWDAAVIGEEHRSAPATAAEIAAARLRTVAWGAGTTREQAEQNKRKNLRPFADLNDGRGAVAHSHLGQAELPARVLPEAQPLETDALAQVAAAQPVARTLTHFEAGRALQELGVSMTPERYGLLRQWHPEGVPETDLPDLQNRLSVRAGMRVIDGGAAVNH